MTLPTPPRVLDLGNGFSNLRGSFKLGCVVELGTHCSLVQRASGRFVLLDACALDGPTLHFIEEQTDGGKNLEAVLHVHPFHTLHVQAMHEHFPTAKLYGTARHQHKAADLPWEALRTEDPALHELFADDFDFSVPRGVDFIPSNENLHFSSVLVIHRASKTLHVDDTLLYVRLPKPLRPLKEDTVRLHPTLPKVLERRPGAAADFRSWGRELVERTRSVDNLCAAHSASLLARDNTGASIAERIERALYRTDRTLRAHERKYS